MNKIAGYLILCFVSLSTVALADTYPEIPAYVSSTKVKGFNGEEANFYVWAEGGGLYLHVAPTTKEMYINGIVSVIIVQDEQEYKDCPTFDENRRIFCSNINEDRTFKIETISPAKFDANKPLTFIWDNSTNSYSFEVRSNFPSVIIPYLNDKPSSNTFLMIANVGEKKIIVDAELMEDDGNRIFLEAIRNIKPDSTLTLHARELTSMASSVIRNNQFALKLIYNNAELDKVHTACIMSRKDGQRVLPVYKTDKANVRNLLVNLFVPFLGSKQPNDSFVKINNWSNSMVSVSAKIRQKNGDVFMPVDLPPIKAHSTNIYWASEIAKKAGTDADSFSTEFTVIGSADKIFGVACQKDDYGQRVLPIYKNHSTTNSSYSYY